MVCYARPASLLAAIVAVAWLVFSGPLSHFFSTAAVMVAVHAPVPVHPPPLQPLKVEPVAGAAVSVTAVL